MAFRILITWWFITRVTNTMSPSTQMTAVGPFASQQVCEQARKDYSIKTGNPISDCTSLQELSVPSGGPTK